MRKRLAAVLLGLALAAPAGAQQQLDFLKGIPEYERVPESLTEWLRQRAEKLLEKRREAVARLATLKDVAKRREYIRKRMAEAVGGFPERTPLNARVVGVVERDDYRIEKIIFESQPRFYVTANLYVPKRGRPPYPAVLFPEGHERGGKSHETWQRMLGSLAKKGYVALTWDTLGQGERAQMYDRDFSQRKLVHSTTEHTMLGIQCLIVGDSLARYTIWDGIRALDYLVSRPEVDKERIACTGNSGGGTHTAYLSALDDRIKVAAPSCYITSWGRLLATIGPQDAEQVLLPWLAAGLDHGDFLIAFAPKPYLMLSAIRDFFSIAGARATFREVKALYERLGAAEKLAMHEVDAGHGYHQPNREAAYRWFARWLKGTEESGEEPEIELAEFDELACTETGQVATSLGGETVHSLNLARARALDPKLPAVKSRADLQTFRDEIRRRVRRLSGIDYERSPVRTSPFGRIERDGYFIEKFVYESAPGIEIPALLFVPEGGPARKPALVWADGKGKSAEAGSGGEIEWFVRQGRIVLAPDLRGLGEMRPADVARGAGWTRYFGDYDAAMTAFLIGESLVGMRAADILKAVDILAARDDVDASRISGVGRGMAAVPLLYAAALDDRLRTLAFERMLISYRDVVEKRIHRQVLENIIPGVLKQFDLPDLVASLAPRKVLLADPVDALGHRLWPRAAREAYARPAAVYKAAGAPHAIQVARRRMGQGPAPVYGEWLQ